MNKAFEGNTFPSNLKKSDVTPAFKADDSTCKKNFRPTSVLSTLSKIFERLLYSQMLPFIKPKLSNLLCGFREGYSQDRREGGSRGNCPGARAPPGARRKRSFAFPLYVAMISSSWAPQGARKIELSLLVQLSFILENSTSYKNHLNQ